MSAGMSDKPRIGIVGCGLIGGSLALAACRAGYPVIGTDLDASVKDEFIRRTGGGWAHTAEALAARADLIVLAVPADAIPDVVEALVPHLREGTVLTDVSSTKTSPTMALRAAPAGVVVVGSHPMAGSATAGFGAATSDLFNGCTWVLCPADGERVPAALTRLVVDVGAAQTLVCSPEEHDRAVAAISHGVQVSATSLAAAVDAIVADANLPWTLAAGGWRDSTRIAESDPDMWVPILEQNRENVLPVLSEIETRLRAMREALTEGDSTAVRRLIVDGQRARQRWQNGRATGHGAAL